ncbi:MAG: hypothetical protein ABI165_13460, partial [Bryobacteraceae bacterium]
MSGPQSPLKPRRLNSWREIARYLNVRPWTVRRLARTAGLPVRRSMPNDSAVFAYVEELDRWQKARATGAF